jgi:hypothetical protein
MTEMSVNRGLTDRMVRAARLDTAVYNEVEADVDATGQALTVVVIAAVASGIGVALSAALAGRQTAIVGGLIGSVVTELIGWAIFSFVMYFVGTRFFGGTASYGELLRTTGFAYTPTILLIFRFIPFLGGIITIIVGIWRIIAAYIAVREALDLDNAKTIGTVVVGLIGYLIVAFIVSAILGAFGLSPALLAGSPA